MTQKGAEKMSKDKTPNNMGDFDAINEVVELLNNIADAWKEIGPHSQNMRDNY